MSRFLLFCFTFFFLSTLSYAEKLIIEPEMGRAPVLAALKNTKSSLDMVMYGFTDNEFMDALVNMQKSGKNVYVMLEKTPYRSTDENTLASNTLKSGHINLQWANPSFKLTHQKTIITDHKTALIMTFNLTHSSFTKERNFALIVTDPAMIREIENVFIADWKHTPITPTNPNLVWSPDNSRDKLLDFIRSAKSSIEVYVQDLADYKTIGALAGAAKRGVNVDILTSTPTSNKNKNKYAYLTKAGAKIHFSTTYYIHAKVIIIDHRRAMLGSMNLTQSSIEHNRELSVITNNEEVIQQLENTFTYDCGKKTSTGSKLRWWLQTLNSREAKQIYSTVAHAAKMLSAN